MASNKKTVADGNASLQKIVGARLTSVQFVLNYLILGFNGKGALTTLVWPEIYADQITLQFGMQGYRDSLCDLMTSIVESVEITAEETIVVAFKNDTQLRIRLSSYKLSGERAIFTTAKHVAHVW